MTLRAGFAAVDLAPPLGSAMGGYAARSGVATGALDALQCRAAVFASEETAVVLLLFDLLYVGGAWATALRRRVAQAFGVEPSAVLVAATHTHSGPAVFAPMARSADLDAFERATSDLALETALRGREALEPGSLSFGEADVRGVGASRREAADPLAGKVRVAAARRSDGSPIGAIASYGCHPTVLPPANLLYSRDLFGAAVDAAAAQIGAPILLFNGAAADVSTRFTRREPTAAEVERLGGELGAALVQATRNAHDATGDRVAAESRRVAVETNQLPDEAEASERMAAAIAAVEQLEGAPVAERRLATSRLEGAMAQLYLARQGGWPAIFARVPKEAEVQQLRIGDLAVLAAPGEVFSLVGETICARGKRLLVGYANDYLGYLVPPAFAGDGEYEALMAMLRPESAAAIGAALQEMSDA